jgi:hypothetical protein
VIVGVCSISIAVELERSHDRRSVENPEVLVELDVYGKWAMQEVFGVYKDIGAIIYNRTDSTRQRIAARCELLKHVEERLGELEEHVEKSKALSDVCVGDCKLAKREIEIAQGELEEQEEDLNTARTLTDYVDLSRHLMRREASEQGFGIDEVKCRTSSRCAKRAGGHFVCSRSVQGRSTERSEIHQTSWTCGVRRGLEV